MAKKKEAALEVIKITEDKIEFLILGRTPLIYHSMSAKVLQDLLLPRGRKTTAEKKSTLKHDPYQEFRDAPHYAKRDDGETLLSAPATWFKNAIKAAALDVPGATKAQLGRLLWVNGLKEHDHINVYGVPRLFMTEVRMSDMNRTPDVRTRAILGEWACRISVSYITPILSKDTVGTLLAAAGLIVGAGDWRPQKGSGTYGQFEIVAEDDKRFHEVVKNGGRDAQVKAMEACEPWDERTEALLAWFDPEVKRRGFEVAS